MSLLLEALKRAERAKRQQTEGIQADEVAASTPPVLPPATNEPAPSTARQELDLSGLEAFEASLLDQPSVPTLTAEEGATTGASESVAPLEFAHIPLDLAPPAIDSRAGESDNDLPTIEWSALELDVPSAPSPLTTDSPALLETTGSTLDTTPPERVEPTLSAPPSAELTFTASSEKTPPLTITPSEPPPSLALETITAAAATLAPEPPAASPPEKTAQFSTTAKPPATEAAREEAQDKARRLLGKPAPAIPEPATPPRVSRRQWVLLSLLLGAVTIGAGGTYFFWPQMTLSPTPMTTPPPAATANELATEAATESAATAQTLPPSPTGSASPEKPAMQTKEPAPGNPEDLAHAPHAPAPPPAPEAAPAPTTPAAPAGPISIVRNPPRIDVLDESVRQGFAAYERGDYHNARLQYQRAVKADPRNRQAMLGLAATEEANGNASAAATLYTQALTLDPRDSVAQAALLSLTTADPSQGESKLRSLLAEQPDRPFLHFALGNVLAAQQRWPEAEQAYFRASGLDPSNPDFAFNLAVSLDQLHQLQPAREHYQRALDLADKRPARFDRQAARQRLGQLSPQA